MRSVAISALAFTPVLSEDKGGIFRCLLFCLWALRLLKALSRDCSALARFRPDGIRRVALE